MYMYIILLSNKEPSIWPCSPRVSHICSSVVRASNWYLEGHGFDSCWGLRKFFFWVFRLENASSLYPRNLNKSTALFSTSSKTTLNISNRKPSYSSPLKNNHLFQSGAVSIQRPTRTKHHEVLQKAHPNAIQDIHTENKKIATELGIDDRVDTTANKDTERPQTKLR